MELVRGRSSSRLARGGGGACTVARGNAARGAVTVAVCLEVATRVAQGGVVCGLLCLGACDGVTFTLMTCYYIHNH